MTKKTLIAISAARDLLDVALIGQVPGLNWALNVPVLYLHYRYAGLPALLTLLENVPGVATLPFFTAAAMSYPDRDQPQVEAGEKQQ